MSLSRPVSNVTLLPPTFANHLPRSPSKRQRDRTWTSVERRVEELQRQVKVDNYDSGEKLPQGRQLQTLVEQQRQPKDNDGEDGPAHPGAESDNESIREAEDRMASRKVECEDERREERKRAKGGDEDGEVSKQQNAAFSDLQAQLHETQASLTSHIDKVRELEGLLKEQESIKRDFSELRQFIRFNRHSTQSEQSDDDDNDDAQSVVTVVPHELATVAEEDEDQEEEAGQSRVPGMSQPREEKVQDVDEEAEEAER